MHLSFLAAQQLGSPMEITRFGEAIESIEGHVQLALKADHGITSIA